MRVVRQIMRCLVAQIVATMTILKIKLKLCFSHTTVKTVDQRPVILVEHVSWKVFNVKTMVHGRNYKMSKMTVIICINALAL